MVRILCVNICVSDITAATEQHAAANHQGPPDVTADLPPQEGSTCEPEAVAADKNGEEGNDEPTEGSTEGKEGVGEGMEDDSNGDDAGGETQKSDEPKPQKRKWGDRDGRYSQLISSIHVVPGARC